MTVERTLKKLQQAVRVGRKATDGERPGYYRVLPDDLLTEDVGGLVLTHVEDDFRQRAISELLADLRFEHLEKEVETRVWRLVCLAYLDRERDHVADFIAEYGQEPQEVMCFFSVAYMNVMAPLELGGALLLPLGDERIPVSDYFQLAPPENGVIAVPITGTNQKFMRDRARLHARHVLRALRVGSRADPQLHPHQLRFRLSSRYVFDTRAAGWDLPEDAAFETPLNDKLLARVQDQELASIAHEPKDDAERHAKLALE